MANGPPELVEHFFRHESANLIAVLTRAFGVGHLGLIEDKVQDALMAAMQTWPRQGVPHNPSGWIYRVARNRVLDAIRRESTYQRVLTASGHTETSLVSQVEAWLDERRLPDSLLRMIFVCCHPALDRRSQIALTLKVLCGFGLAEVASGLLISTEAAKKRVQRATKRLSDLQIEVVLPPAGALHDRLDAVHEVLYLLFNEGYSTSRGPTPLRDDICEEAARLGHLICRDEVLGTSDSRALLALMLAHASRLDARLDEDGDPVLLADQDRSRWDRRLIAHAETWFARSKTDAPSRFHYEAAIALTHCQASSVEDTDWPHIVALYDRLLVTHPSPLYVLNRAIALGETGATDSALIALTALRDRPELRGYVLLDCAIGRLHEKAGRRDEATAAYTAALEKAEAPHAKTLLTRQLARLRT